MDLDWLQDIICLENSRSFTKAARERNVTQSALSRRVRSLEAWLDAPLIDRTSYPIQLTPAGEAFLPVARNMVAQLQLSRQDLRDSVINEGRILRIATPHSIASTYLAQNLAELYLEDPALRTRVISDNAVVCFDLFSQGYCDILLTYSHPAIAMSLDGDRFKTADLGPVRILPVAESRMVQKNRWSLPGSTSHLTPLLAYDRDSFLGGVVAHILGSRTTALHLQTRHTDAFAEAIKTVCMAGVGVAWLPEPLVRHDLYNESLVTLGDESWQTDMHLSLYVAADCADEHVMSFYAALAKRMISV